MASTSSREAALERRRALTTGGKQASSRFTSGQSRVRTVVDARPTRTGAAPAASASASATPAPTAPATQSPASRSLTGPSSGRSHSAARPIANPSRDLVLARRDALSRRGKRADTSKDRTRTATDVVAPASAAPIAAVSSSASVKHDCDCKGSAKLASLSAPSRSDSFASGRSDSAATSRKVTA